MHMLAVETRVLPQTEKRHRHHRNKTWKLANRPFSTSFPFPATKAKTHDREAKLAETINQNHQLYLFTPVTQELCCFRGNG
jgi:hypothetical protein